MPYPPKDGGTIGIYNVVDSLGSCGNEVHVLAINTPKHFIKDSEIPDEVKQKLHLETVFINTNIHVFGLIKNILFSDLPYTADRFFSAKYQEKLKELLRKYTFDIVQIEGLYMCTYIETVRKYSKAVISLRAHNIEHEIWQRTSENENNRMKKMYLKHLTKRIIKLKETSINEYDILVPITERDEAVYTKMGNLKPSMVLPVGIDLSKFIASGYVNHKHSLFHIGALDWVPNQEGLLWFISHCWPILKNKVPEITFHIAGRNAPSSFLKKITQNDIIFHGEVPDAGEFIKEYGIMVVPLLSGSGIRIKIIEGMAYGKPIITTPIGVEGISATHRENILIADNEFSFVNEIEKVVSDDSLFDKISSNAIRFVHENYENTRLAIKLTEFYKTYSK